ncbi:MAG TPA: aldo/keto reductase [Longimicrobiales bacterium]|nr:aldo/keto reductase [Longimicrobiales bacterium]
MDTRRIGPLEVSVVGLGCNNFGKRLDAAQTERVVHAALDAGISFFDTADRYSAGRSEEYLGRALRGRRHEALIATKFGKPVGDAPASATAAYIRQAVDASLRRLGVDHIDLYQIHEPHPEVPIAETLGALDELVGAGKVRAIGCSNFSAQQIEEAESTARASGGARFVSVQNEYSLLVREPEQDGVLDACARYQLALLPFFPLASGLLTGKYRVGRPLPENTRITSGWLDTHYTEANLARVERLSAFAQARGHTLLELAFAWLLHRGEVASVIAGATRPEQVRANAAATRWQLSAQELAEVDAALAG